MISNENKSLMKQFVITHIIHLTEIPALPDSWVTIEFILHSVNTKGYKTTGYRTCK